MRNPSGLFRPGPCRVRKKAWYVQTLTLRAKSAARSWGVLLSLTEQHCRFYSAVLSFYYDGVCEFSLYKATIFCHTSTDGEGAIAESGKRWWRRLWLAETETSGMRLTVRLHKNHFSKFLRIFKELFSKSSLNGV